MPDLNKRIAALERVRGPNEVQVIQINGGLTAFDDAHATVGAETIERDPGETFGMFWTRTLTAAKTAGERFVIIGGLPA
jgi:hypothetical protein